MKVSIILYNNLNLQLIKITFLIFYMRPEPDIFESIISKPRLKSYKDYFKTTNTEEAIGLYMWNCELSTCFNMLLSFFEIALRNSIHREMSLYRSYKKSDNYPWYEKHKNLKEKIEENRLTNYLDNPNIIVSRIHFGFWI